MIPIPVLELTLEGQKVKYNELSKVLLLNIDDPFYSAGKVLGWKKEYGSAGFGINQEIVKFIMERKAKILIKSNVTPNKEYWCDFSRLAFFIKNNNSQYFTKRLWLNIFPWKIFHSKPNFENPL